MIADRWWDARGWNPFGGCSHASPGCLNCYAQRPAGTWLKHSAAHKDLGTYDGVTDLVKGKPVFNGKLTVAPDGHPHWAWPLRWPGAQHPVLGPGMPSLIFVGDMSDLFHEQRPAEVIDRVVGTIALSDHTGLLLTKRADRMAEYFLDVERSRPPGALRRWRDHLWLGFSAERQREFDQRWPLLRPLATSGYLVFVSIAPMLGPVRLPQDFLALGRWVIVSGEQGPPADVRPMDALWALAVREQCAEAGIPFFLLQMTGKRRIPPALLVREFPLPKEGDSPCVTAMPLAAR
jgi:protein gp37